MEIGRTPQFVQNGQKRIGAGIDVAPYIGDARRMIDQGQTAVYVARDGRLLGVMGVSHRLRPGTRSALERLRASGVRRIVLISGDEPPVAEALSRQLGLDVCHAGLLPEDTYTLTITNLLEKNPASSHYRITLDAVEVLGTLTASSNRYEQDHEDLGYGGNWTSYSESGASGGSYVLTGQIDALGYVHGNHLVVPCDDLHIVDVVRGMKFHGRIEVEKLV